MLWYSVCCGTVCVVCMCEDVKRGVGVWRQECVCCGMCVSVCMVLNSCPAELPLKDTPELRTPH